MSLTSSAGLGFTALVFSDLRRYRPDEEPTWRGVLMRCLSNPGMVASLILRAQQRAYQTGRVRRALLLRSIGMTVVGADFVPGMDVGPGLLMPHPTGVVIGNGLRVGANVTFGGGVTAGVKQPDVDPATEGQGFPEICDGAIVLANAVLAGPVRIGEFAQVGANTVVLSDVEPCAVVFGVPARKVAVRKPVIPGSYEEVGASPSAPGR
jgi:serine O-acetyltransferase